MQAALFLRAGQQRRPVHLSSTGARQGVGLALAAYSLAYLFLTMALGHDLVDHRREHRVDQQRDDVLLYVAAHVRRDPEAADAIEDECAKA